VGKTDSKKEIKEERTNGVTVILCVLCNHIVSCFQRVPRSIQIQVHLSQNAQITYLVRGAFTATERHRHLTYIAGCVRALLKVQWD
jgi:hypothetical protein